MPIIAWRPAPAAAACCNAAIASGGGSSTRVIKNVPRQVTPVVTEHTIHGDYCPRCKRHVEPVLPDATLGHYVNVLSSWFHYGLGIMIGQVREILAAQMHTDVTGRGVQCYE